MKCSQCSRTVSLWRLGLVTGICPSCQLATGAVATARLNRMVWSALRAVRYLFVIGMLLFVIGLLYCTPMISGARFDTPFSQEVWHRGDAQARGLMARDLVSSRQLMDKPQEEVLAILGPPDVERFGGQTIRFRVDLGYRWVIRPYLYDLVVRFGKGNEVFQVAIEPPEKA